MQVTRPLSNICTVSRKVYEYVRVRVHVIVRMRMRVRVRVRVYVCSFTHMMQHLYSIQQGV